MELNVNRNNPALGFYEHMGMKKVREGDFPIGNGYYMNDYIMGLDINVYIDTDRQVIAITTVIFHAVYRYGKACRLHSFVFLQLETVK